MSLCIWIEERVQTDSLFYRLFMEYPRCFFELVGRPMSDAERYRFEAIEFKHTTVRLDGVYMPLQPGNDAPAYLVEYQNHRSERVYSNLLLKMGCFWKRSIRAMIGEPW
jgi:predicted transposase YdaD